MHRLTIDEIVSVIAYFFKKSFKIDIFFLNREFKDKNCMKMCFLS